MDYSEAALAAGIPLGTVKSRLARARLSLQNELAMLRPASRPLTSQKQVGATSVTAESTNL